jgi:hypothetical protein
MLGDWRKKMKIAVALTAAMLAIGSVTAYAQGGPDMKGPGGGGGGDGPSLGGGGGGGRDGGGGGGGGPSFRGGGDGGGGGPSLRGGGDRGGGFERAKPDRAERAGPGENRATRAYRAEREERSSPKSDEGSKGRLSRDEDHGDKSRPSKDSKAEKSVKDQEKTAKDQKSDDKKDEKKADRGKPDDAIGDRDKKGEAARSTDKDEGKPSKSAEESSRKDAKLEKAKEVQLSTERRDRVRDEFRKVRDVKRQTHVDVQIGVGRRLPRHWHFYPVPIAIFDFIPEYRDYVFVYVDDEYVICDPDTYEVVAVVDAPVTTAESRGGGPGRCSTDLRLSDRNEGLILGSVRLDDDVDARGLRVGWDVPHSIELHEFEDSVISRIPELESCRYFVSEEQVAIVDPRDERVVLLVENSEK